MDKKEDKNMIKVIIIEPGKAPYLKEIVDELECLQEIVGGYIEPIYPFEDDVALVCNEEGKLNGLPQNRALISNENGDIMDIIRGTFFLVYAPFEEDGFRDMPSELIKKYSECSKNQNVFIRHRSVLLSRNMSPKLPAEIQDKR